MKSLASFKVIPYVGLALVAVMQGLKNRKQSRRKVELLDKNQGVPLQGKINKNLEDSSGFISQIAMTNGNLWVVSEEELAAVGEEVAFVLGKRFEAYESVDLGMAFETVYFISKMGPVNELGNVSI